MTYDELMLALDEIRDEFCPTTPEQKKAAMEQGYYDLCGCAICHLQQELIISEINNGAGITPPNNAINADAESGAVTAQD